jgi:predicted RNA-binding protein (virulence factor B family)
MIEIGKYNTLRIDRAADQGVYLEDEEGNDVLLPGKYVPDQWDFNDMISVFVYNDSEDRIVATTETPKIQLNGFALLEITGVSRFGAFADWGLQKDLLIPLKNQGRKLEEGDRVVVYMYLDEKTNRLVGTTKFGHLKDNPLSVGTWDEVDLIVANRSDLGWNVIINNMHLGVVYENEVFQPISTGDRLTGYIKKIRDDGKIDVALKKPGYGHVEPNAQKILDVLKENDGQLFLSDNSDPDDIVEKLQMSKKTFKKAIGALFKQRLIRIEKDGIYLNE